MHAVYSKSSIFHFISHTLDHHRWYHQRSNRIKAIGITSSTISLSINCYISSHYKSFFIFYCICIIKVPCIVKDNGFRGCKLSKLTSCKELIVRTISYYNIMLMTYVSTKPDNLCPRTYYGILWDKRLSNKSRFIFLVWSMMCFIWNQYNKML